MVYFSCYFLRGTIYTHQFEQQIPLDWTLPACSLRALGLVLGSGADLELEVLGLGADLELDHQITNCGLLIAKITLIFLGCDKWRAACASLVTT